MTKTETQRLKQCWWSWAELNRRPSACKADALPTELQPHSDFQNHRMAIEEESVQSSRPDGGPR